MKGNPTFLKHYGGSLIRCLMDVYPDIGLKVTDQYKLPRTDNSEVPFDILTVILRRRILERDAKP